MKNNLFILNRHFVSALLALFALPALLSAQKVLSLKECYESASGASALAGEKKAYENLSGIKQSNISKGWLPAIDLNGSALYNSEVVDLSQVLGKLPVPGIAGAIKPLPHDQYKITLDLNQVIYDGGAIKGARDLEKADVQVNMKQTDADLYKIKSQINALYFSVLLLDRQKELLNSFLDLLNNKIKTVQSAIENGVKMKTDADILISEKIKANQQITEYEIRRTSMLKVLSEITGLSISNDVVLVQPETKDYGNEELQRPELQLFDLKQQQLDASLSLVESKRLPKAFGFATFGYGNPPGSNFFRNEFDTYYIIGAGIKWNIFDWNKTKNEKKVISIQKGIIENRKTDLSDNLKRQLETKKAEIINLEKMAASDSELIALRKNISAAAESQYQNGTLTAVEYLDALNSEKQSMINSEIHRISLAMAKTEYLNINGKDIE